MNALLLRYLGSLTHIREVKLDMRSGEHLPKMLGSQALIFYWS